MGLRPGVGLLEGCACEFVLGSLLAFVVLLSAQSRSGWVGGWWWWGSGGVGPAVPACRGLQEARTASLYLTSPLCGPVPPMPPACSALRLWVPLLATVVAVKAGERLTGPCLNPAFSLSWLAAFPHQQGVAEHLAVFWAAPVAAGLFGGWAFKGWQQQQCAAVQGVGSAAKQQQLRAKRD